MLLFVLMQCPFSSCWILLNGFVSVAHCVRGNAADAARHLLPTGGRQSSIQLAALDCVCSGCCKEQKSVAVVSPCLDLFVSSTNPRDGAWPKPCL